jgi:hypothetical protein
MWFVAHKLPSFSPGTRQRILRIDLLDDYKHQLVLRKNSVTHNIICKALKFKILSIVVKYKNHGRGREIKRGIRPKFFSKSNLINDTNYEIS